MKATSVTWRRTFPDSAPGTDGVAIFEGRVIGRVRQDEHCAGKPWLWSVTDPELAGKPGWANTPSSKLKRRNGAVLWRYHATTRMALVEGLT